MRARKRRIYVGCEGEYEYAYVLWLRRLIQEERMQVYLEPDNLKGGGLRKMAKCAAANIKRMDRDEPFSHRYLLLDIDRAEQYPEELADLKKILPKHQEEIVWQKPCGEAIQLATAWIKAPGNRIRLDGTAQAREEYRRYFGTDRCLRVQQMARVFPEELHRLRELNPMPEEIGRASCRATV